MSRVQNYSFSGYPSSYDTTNSSTAGATNPDNGCTNTGSTTYAEFTSKSSEGERNYYYNFTTNIPSFAVITNVSCYIRARTAGSGERYMGYAQLCHGTTNKGTETQIDTIDTGTSISLTTGSWNISEISDIKIRITPNRVANNRYVRFYGANLIISYTITWYSISTASSVAGVSITSSAAEVESGNSVTLTTNASSLVGVTIKDNGVDVTSNFTGASGNYGYTLTNVNADHSFTVTEKSSQGSGVSTKENGSWNEASAVYKKVSGSWVQQTDTQNIFTDGVYKKTDGTVYVNENN